MKGTEDILGKLSIRAWLAVARDMYHCVLTGDLECMRDRAPSARVYSSKLLKFASM